MKTPLILKNAFKGFKGDQDKICTPEETVERVMRRLSGLELDILKDARRIDNGRLGIPVYFSECGKDAEAATGTKKQMGKGAMPAQAKASAVMELAERYSFFSFCNTPGNFITAAARDLAKDAIGFDAIAMSVHDASDELAVTQDIYESIPMRWTWAYNLTTGHNLLVPFDWFFTINEFNGPSAGNGAEEALSQGICEIVERHVSSLISHGMLKTPAIDPDSADDAVVTEMIAKYRAIGVRFFLSDFTLDTGIPTVGMLAYDPSTFPGKSEIVWTAGTTPDPQKALSRAMTEVAQLAGDFNTESNYVASGLPKFRSLKEAEYVIGGNGNVKNITDLPDLSDDNIRVEVENLVQRLAGNGFEVMVVDTMNNDLKIPAFYTIIPGAHFRERALGTSVGMFSAKIISNTFSPEKARQALADMNRRLPGKHYVNFYLGTTCLSLNDPKTGLEYLKKALDCRPVRQDIPSIYSYMGVCLKELGKFKEALSILEKGIAEDNERTDLYNLKGFCHFKRKEHQAAIAAFEKVIELDPSSAIDYANIASNYRDMGRNEEAIRYYELALSMDPSIEFALENLLKLRSKT